MDRLTRAERSRLMARIRGANTRPELVVRRILSVLGIRYRIHERPLPGTPDIVLTRARKAIFVHGCFWHRHSCRRGQSMPSTHRRFWEKKLRANRLRDRCTRRRLRDLGWKILVVWECQTTPQRLDHLAHRLAIFAGPLARDPSTPGRMARRNPGG